jgi:hypothetical protein
MTQRDEALTILAAILGSPLLQAACRQPNVLHGAAPTLQLDEAVKLAIALQESFNKHIQESSIQTTASIKDRLKNSDKKETQLELLIRIYKDHRPKDSIFASNSRHHLYLFPEGEFPTKTGYGQSNARGLVLNLDALGNVSGEFFSDEQDLNEHWEEVKEICKNGGMTK